jgi:hypothetical protein
MVLISILRIFIIGLFLVVVMNARQVSAQNYVLAKKYGKLLFYNADKKKSEILIEDYQNIYFVGNYAEFYSGKIYFFVDFIFDKPERRIYSYDVQEEILHPKLKMYIEETEKNHYRISIDTVSYLSQKEHFLSQSLTGKETSFLETDYRYSTKRMQYPYYKSDSYGNLIQVDSLLEQMFAKNYHKSFWDLRFNGYRSPDINLDGNTLVSAFIHKKKEMRKTDIEQVSIVTVDIDTKQTETVLNSEFWFKPYWFGTGNYILLRHLPKHETPLIMANSNPLQKIRLKYTNYYILNIVTKDLHPIMFSDYCIPVINVNRSNSLFLPLLKEEN